MTGRARVLALLLTALLPVVAGAPGTAAETEVERAPVPETLTYEWRLKGFTGVVARLFVPGRGEGRLETVAAGDELLSELRLTATGARAGEFWKYAATIDPASGLPTSAWTEYRFRDRERRRDAEFADDEEVVDIPSGIRLLRTRPPLRPTRKRIWSDGKIYPVLFQAGEPVVRRIGGEHVPLMLYRVVGLSVPGERRWKGELRVLVTRDERAIPVEIEFSRLKARVELQLITPLLAASGG